jgi:hypothetical protein
MASPCSAGTIAVPQRQSSRIAAKAGGNFIHFTDKAMQLKALQNALAPCSAKLKTVVEQCKLLTKSKGLFNATNLRKMVTAVGLGYSLDSTLSIVAFDAT